MILFTTMFIGVSASRDNGNVISKLHGVYITEDRFSNVLGHNSQMVQIPIHVGQEKLYPNQDSLYYVLKVGTQYNKFITIDVRHVEFAPWGNYTKMTINGNSIYFTMARYGHSETKANTHAWIPITPLVKSHFDGWKLLQKHNQQNLARQEAQDRERAHQEQIRVLRAAAAAKRESAKRAEEAEKRLKEEAMRFIKHHTLGPSKPTSKSAKKIEMEKQLKNFKINLLYTKGSGGIEETYIDNTATFKGLQGRFLIYDCFGFSDYDKWIDLDKIKTVRYGIITPKRVKYGRQERYRQNRDGIVTIRLQDANGEDMVAFYPYHWTKKGNGKEEWAAKFYQYLRSRRGGKDVKWCTYRDVQA